MLVCSSMLLSVYTVFSWHRKAGMKPKIPTKKLLARNTTKQIATFSLHACLASTSSFRMHLSGTHSVTHLLKLYHHMQRLSLATSFFFRAGTFLMADWLFPLSHSTPRLA